MKKGGIGGGNTVTGLRFEEKVNLLTKIQAVPGYTVKDNVIYYEGEPLAYSYRKQAFLRDFLAGQNKVDLDKYFSKGYEPDEALYVPSQKTVYIIEMKFQNVSGSVDEKLQTSDFKRKLYNRALQPLGLKAEFIFILSEFFDNPRYQDSYDYVRESGCSYYFEELPFDKLGFPTPEVDPSKVDQDDVELN